MEVPFAAPVRALFLTLVRPLLRPGGAFADAPPPLGRALLRMLAVWVPLALANAALTVWRALQAYGELRRSGPPDWLERLPGADPEVLWEVFRTLPAPPAFGRIWPWLLLVVPIGVLGTWFHHAVWDHTGLWLLGGLKERRGFRTSLGAEAEALRMAALGTLIGLLGFLPVLGVVLAVPLLLLDGYLWLFRGFALAARHGCELWRGVGATVVHAVLLGACGLGLVAMMLVLLGTAP
ncbi:hypothetical protein [Geothrix edaphica]|uniref:Yip1 domain-containing protein n=1 Tax=Geothrix edaphica TaxID=2927976 RepID=A0ABQ5Q1A8_9BACT|nr:hypothetical protein [Geothrix edaphica]GLH68427.1 hypothetical protein GETHED_27910 [Geothrix edaphica]